MKTFLVEKFGLIKFYRKIVPKNWLKNKKNAESETGLKFPDCGVRLVKVFLDCLGSRVGDVP